MMQPTPASNRLGIATLGLLMVLLAVGALNVLKVLK